MQEEIYRNLVILLLCILIGLYIYDLNYNRNKNTTNQSNNILPSYKKKLSDKKNISNKNKQCIGDLCPLPPQIKSPIQLPIQSPIKLPIKSPIIIEKDAKSIGDIDNSLDDIGSVVKKISNI